MKGTKFTKPAKDEIAYAYIHESELPIYKAAPVLLAALRGIVENCCINCDGNCDLLKDGQAAIAKAKGEG